MCGWRPRACAGVVPLRFGSVMIVRHFLYWVRSAEAAERAEATSALARAYLHSDLSQDDRIVGLVILSGKERGFCAGADLTEMEGAITDWDFNNLDSQHVTLSHPKLDKHSWMQAYRDAFVGFYTLPKLLHTVLSVAGGRG